MKVLSEQVIDDVECMNRVLAQIQKKQAHSSRFLNASQLSAAKHSVDDEVAAQIKLVVDLPEVIWSAIDDRDYIRAAQLFLLGRHVKTGFSVDKNLKKVKSGLLILERQWSTLSYFPSIILKGAENNLKMSSLKPEESCTCLVSITLLENVSLISKFLTLRTESLDNVLNGSDDVKGRILDSHNAVVDSIYAVHYCFIEAPEAGNGNVWKTIQRISNPQSPPVISSLEKSVGLKYLPPIITQFRANPINRSEPTAASNIKESVAHWLTSVKEIIVQKGNWLLQNISTLRSLHALANINIRPQPEWGSTLRSLEIGEELDLWNDLYKPIINTRAKQLITLHWEEAFSQIVAFITKLMNEDIEKEPELDLRWYTWKESPNDLELKHSPENPRGLWLKAKGISPRVAGICKLFQAKLETLFKDLSDLCSHEDILTKDTKELRSHHQSACLKIILRLKEFVRDLINNEETDETKLAIIARFLQSIPDLCPGLQKCLTLADENKVNSWHEAKTLLHMESLSCWSTWEDKMTRIYTKRIADYLEAPKTYADLLNIIPQWDIIIIEEGEEGESVHKSQLKIPSFPSLPLQSLLHYISSDVCRAHVPRLVYENLLQKLVPSIVEQYSMDVLCQAQALQQLFDFKYLLAQFAPSTNKELCNLCQEKISIMENKIDPFDLDVFSPHIHKNVKSSVQRLQGLFGMTVYIGESTPSAVKASEDPCIIPLSKTSTNVWFPPLPVTNPANRPVQIMKSKPSLATGKSSSIDNATDNEIMSKGGTTASSFFTDWFS